MVEPATEKGRRAKQTIVATAADLVQHRGVADTKINDVLDACGMGKSQFYHYFADKDELVREVVQYRAQTFYQERFLEPMRSVKSLTGLRQWLRDFGDMVVAGQYIGGCPVGSLAMQLSQDERILREAINQVLNELYQSFYDALERIRDRGDFPKSANIDQLAIYLVGAFQGGLLLSRSYQDPTKLRTVLRQAETHFKQLAIS